VVLHIGSPGGLQADIASTQQGVLSAKQTGTSPGMQLGIDPEEQNVPLSHIAAPLELDEDEEDDEDEDEDVVLHIGSRGGLQLNIASTQHASRFSKQIGVSPTLQFGI